MNHLATCARSAAAAVLLCCAANAQANDGRRVAVDIKPQPVLGALKQLGEQTGLQLLMRVDDATAESILVQPVSGQLSLKAALDKLLANTGLTYEFINDRTIRISRKANTPTSSIATSAPQSYRVATIADNSVADTRGGGQDEIPTSGRVQGAAKPIQEVVVTAQKREERLIDTPQSVSVLSSDYLEKIGAVQFRDFADSVPGLSYTTGGAGFSQVTLRGVTTGYDVSQTVGIYVDEVPYGSSTAFARGAQVNLDAGLFDIDRIEVLRGPQGTLYGASTLGGLIKYVTTPPSTTRFESQVRAGVSSIEDGGVGYDGAATVNIPLAADKMALRATGFYSHDGGYIENVARGEKDVSQSNLYGARLEFLVVPIEDLSVRIAAFGQNISRDGFAIADLTLAGDPVGGSLEQSRPFAEPFDQHTRMASATISYDLGSAALTSVSSYQNSKSGFVTDISALFAPLVGADGVAVTDNINTRRFTQEIRLSSSGARQVEWTLGGFYTHESSDYGQVLLLDFAGQTTPVPQTPTPSHYEESAVFGDLTWHFTDRFDLGGGLRYANSKVDFGPPPAFHSSDDVVTYLANARYHVSDHATGYIRYATGYRPGGANTPFTDPVSGQLITPPAFDPDKLYSYEAGFKAETTDRRLSVDVAGYFIDWKDMQINVVRNNHGMLGNAPGGAHIRGIELTLIGRPTNALTMSGALAYQDSEMAEADPDLRAAKGERLPNTPRFTAALNADYALPLASFQPTVGATFRYVGDRTQVFEGTVSPPHFVLPSYTTLDLRTAIQLGRANAQLYVHNVFDKQGQLTSPTAAAFPITSRAVVITQPRTIGVMVTAHF
jgi:iron complex outermembrane recepter protein